MCVDDGCDEFLCCLCAPLAAIFCCKLCKDKLGSDKNISQAPNSGFYQIPDGRVPVAGIYGPQGYGPRILNDANFYPGKPQSYYLPQRQAFQGGYFPPPRGQMRQGLSGVYVKHQPRPY